MVAAGTTDGPHAAADAERIWRDYTRLVPSAARGGFARWRFTADPRESDALVDLVLAGRKRATAPALAEFGAGRRPLPGAGDHHLVEGGRGRVRCIVRTEHVEVLPWTAVTAEHARREGEGDGSLASWRRVHAPYYRRVLARRGLALEAATPVVFHGFALVARVEDDGRVATTPAARGPVLQTETAPENRL